MPDIVTYVVASGADYRNGKVLVGANMLGLSSTRDPRLDRDCVARQSGILDARFDDVRYYSGDTTA